MNISDSISERETKRLQGYDLARGLAVFAMVFIDFKMFFCGDETFPEWLFNLIDYMDRRAAALLVMVAGAGITLMLSRADMVKSRNILFKRAVFLILCGIVLSAIWPADILHFYGFFIIIGLAVAGISNPKLITGAVLFWLVGFLSRFDYICGYLEGLADGSLASLLANLLFIGYYPIFPWAALYLLGMWLGRLDLKNIHTTITLLGAGLITVMFSELSAYFIPGMAAKTLVQYGASNETAAYFFALLRKLTVVDLSLPSPMAIVSGTGTGLCVIMLSFLFTAYSRRKPAQYFMIAGKTPLSLYVLHIFMIQAVENLPGMEDQIPVIWASAGAILFTMTCTLLMHLWLQKFPVGPLEGALRHFPYVKTPWTRQRHPGVGAG